MSSFQVRVPGSFTRVAPMCLFACHRATAAPDGSSTKAIRPASVTSNGAIPTWPPAASALAVASSAESTAR
jgi:hypothetical protein